MIWRKGRFYGNFLTPRFFPRSFLRRSHDKKKRVESKARSVWSGMIQKVALKLMMCLGRDLQVIFCRKITIHGTVWYIYLDLVEFYIYFYGKCR